MQKVDKKILKSISSNNTMAFYLDNSNIKNPSLVEDTINHIKKYRSNLYSPIEFLNLLWQQYLFVVNRPDVSNFGGQATDPLETIRILKSLPITKLHQHILFYFIIKWFGGIGGWSHPKVKSLIEDEFKSFKGNTPEKEVYFKDSPQWAKLTYKQFAKMKTDFEKLSYPEKLTFWDKNIYNDTHYWFSVVGLNTDGYSNRDAINSEYTISIFPNNTDEIKTHNQWLFDHINGDDSYKTLRLEYLKERYYQNIKNNPRPIEYTEQEIDVINTKKSRQKVLQEAKNDIVLWGYYCGYQSIVRNENTYLTLTADEFKRIAEDYVKGMNSAHYLSFLEIQLKALKQSKKPYLSNKTEHVIRRSSNNKKQRYKKYTDTYNTLTREKKLSHAKALQNICNEYGISEKTLTRALRAT